jgi:uncharacterized protein HemY
MIVLFSITSNRSHLASIFTELISSSPSPQAHTSRDNVLAPLSRAQPLRKGRAYDLAISCLTTALTFPSPPSLRGFAHYQLGCLHLLVKDWAEAKGAFEAALGAGYAPARAGMARLLAQQGDK